MSGRTEWLLELFRGVPEPLAVVGMAALPVAELRLAIPIAIGVYKMSPATAFLYSFLGNMLPVPVILMCFQWGRRVLGPYRPFSWLVSRIDARVEGHRAAYARWGPPALIGFVAIPLPVTGAWTGAAVATAFAVPFLPALAMLATGVLIAGVLVTSLTLLGVGMIGA